MLSSTARSWPAPRSGVGLLGKRYERQCFSFSRETEARLRISSPVAWGSQALLPQDSADASCLVEMDELISVSINDFATGAQREAVQKAFRSAGIDAEVGANYFMKSADLVPWIVSIPLAYSAGAFFNGFFGKLGADAATRMQEWVRELRQAWESSPALPGHIVIRGDGGTTVVIGDPPKEAYASLLELNWEEVEGSYLLWNEERGEWEDGMRG